MRHEHVIKDILISGVDDWVAFGEITCRLGPGLTEDEMLQATLEIVREILERGWMEIGDTSPEFVPRGWTTHQTIAWIEHEWHRLGSGAARDYMCWFANTDTGDRMANDRSTTQKS
jgi:hypothetical protein